LAPYAADFFDEPDLTGIVRSLSLLFVLGTLGIVPRSGLEKEMRFDALAKVDVVSVVGSGTVATAMAFTGWGVWSLVAQRLVEVATKNVLVWRYTTWRPDAQFSLTAAKDLIQYGGNLTGFNMVNRLARTGDDLLIGKFMSAGSLGVYNRAYQLMMLPIKRVIRGVSDVLFPALSSIKHDVKRVRRVFLRTVGAVSFITFPAMMGLIVVADVFVLALLGSKWEPAIPIIRILCVASLVQTLANPTGWIYRSQGRTDWMFRWGLVGSTTLLGAIILGVYLGSIESVAICYTVANVLLLYPVLTIPGWLIDMSFIDVMRAVSGNFGAALAMAAGVYSLGLSTPGAWSPWIVLALQVSTGVGLYWSIAHVSNLSAYRDLLEIGKERWNALRESIAATQSPT
jgi:PST family polysaccharide transporter